MFETVDSQKDCTCGKRAINPDFGVINEPSVAKDQEAPWQVAMYDGDKFICAGTLINNLYLVTAAHCFHYYDKDFNLVVMDKSNFTVYIGRQNLKPPLTVGPNDRFTEKIILHPTYSVMKQVNFDDIALVKLNKPITEYGPTILPICIPQNMTQYADNSTVTYYGWGKVSTDWTEDLRRADITIIPTKECTKVSLEFPVSELICGSRKIDTCLGGGGPLVRKINADQVQQIGINAGRRGCIGVHPTYFIKLDVYLTWIKLETADAVYCEK